MLDNYVIRLIEKTYFDKMDVYRLVQITNPNGSNSQVRQMIESNVSCAYSLGSRPSINSIENVKWSTHYTGALNRVEKQNKVYCNETIDLMQGDELHITQSTGQKWIIMIGEPNIFPSYQVAVAQDSRYA